MLLPVVSIIKNCDADVLCIDVLPWERRDRMEITIRSIKLNEIPLLELFKNDGAAKKPMVLLYHGYLGRKEFILPQAYNLAANGFFVVVPDAYGHGDRSGSRIPELIDCAIRSAAEINGLIDRYRDSCEADYARAGLAGYSMGGMITFQYMTMEDKRIRAAVPVISTPDWASIVDGFNNRARLDELKSYGIIKDDSELAGYRALAEAIQPINRYELMKDIPLLMLCGGNDPVTVPAGAQRLYELLKPIFFDEESLRVKIFPGISHMDTIEMNMDLVNWMKKYVD